MKGRELRAGGVGKCLWCPGVVQRPASYAYEAAHAESDRVGWDITAFCSEACEVLYMTVAMYRLKQDPDMLFSVAFGCNKQTWKDKRVFEKPKHKKVKSATAS